MAFSYQDAARANALAWAASAGNENQIGDTPMFGFTS